MPMRSLVIFFVIIFSLYAQDTVADCLTGNCKLGEGKYKYKDGSVYAGDFVNGKPHGFGIIDFKSGDHYEGNWDAGKRHGEGAYTFSDGSIYRGEFYKNKLQGQGILTYANGRIYDGTWKKNKAEGRGKLTHKSGATYEGLFKNGKEHGQGTFIDPSGRVHAGLWRVGKLVRRNNSVTKVKQKNKVTRHKQTAATKQKNRTESTGKDKNCNSEYCHNEKGKYTYRDGSYFIGNHISGNPEGIGTCFYANGDVYQGGWKNHSPDGEGVMTFASGRKYSAFWASGKPVRQLYNKPDFENDPVRNESKAADGKTEMYALIIGISSYNHMPSLKYTDDDAYRLYAFLKSPEGGAVKEGNISLLIDEVATKENIRTSMKNLFNKADKDDVVIMYYSGHGLQGRFLPIDFDGYNNSLSHREVYDLLDRSEAKHRLVIADACYSGSLSASRAPYSSSLKDFYTKINNTDGGTAILTSSKAEEQSLEYAGLRQGVFSHFLLKGLHGWADGNTDGIVSIAELFGYIQENVKTYTGNRQSPSISGNYNRDMPVAMVRGSTDF